MKKTTTLDDFFNKESDDIGTITINSASYPSILKEIKNPPEMLYFKGKKELLNRSSVAIVGTRKPSKDGRIEARKVTKYYGKKGCIIVSGLARGIDAIAMKTALKIKSPVIGVLPSSLDNIVPKQNQELANQIIEKGGLLISEYPEGTNVQKFHYIQRNRIVTGISCETAVIETSIKGGTIHTVNYAKEQNKNIKVVDIPTDGNQMLIKEQLTKFKFN